MQSTADPRLEDIPDGLDLDVDGRLALVKRIAASKHFIRSPRLTALLVFLCEQAQRGESARLTEHWIAGQVFARKMRFDPNADTIVRSHMVRLRQKLALYFQEDGAHEAIRISIPRGGYAPLFEPMPQASGVSSDETSQSGFLSPVLIPSTSPAADNALLETDLGDAVFAATGDSLLTPDNATPLQVAQDVPSRRWGVARWWGAIALVLLVLAGVGLFRSYRRATTSGGDLLWAQMMPANQPVMLIAADSSLVLLHYHMLHDTSLSDYVSGRYIDDVRDLHKTGVDTMGLEGRRYTSIVDLEMTRSLAQLAVGHRSVFNVRYPRDLNLEDVKKENVIVSGSRGANPWVELFEPMLNFKIVGVPEKHITIVNNRSPLTGEEKVYVAGVPPANATYGVLAFLPGIEPSKNVLLVQGTSVAGTEAISDLLFNRKELEKTLKRFIRPDGTLSHFEVLLAGHSVNNTSAGFRIVASRTYP
jgi:hypothetical protein